MLPRRQRLKSRRDFGVVYRRGRRSDDPLITLHAVRRRGESAETPTRIGFSASKKVGKSHDRNRIKRRLREIVRTLDLRGGFDAVLVARPGSAEREFAEIAEIATQLLERLGLRMNVAAERSE